VALYKFRIIIITIRRYLTDATVLSVNRMALQLTAHATQDWLHATAMTLLQSMNGHQTLQIIMCGGFYAESPSQAGYHKRSTIEELQTRLDMIWNNLLQKRVA